MKRIRQTIALALLALAAARLSPAGDNTGGADAGAEKKITHLQNLLTRMVIDTKAFPEEMPLVKFLAAVREQLPGKEKIALRLEKKELGKKATRLADAPVRCSGLRMSLHTILRKVVGQVSREEELDYAIRPDGIVITRARLAAHSMAYDIGDIVREIPSLLPSLKKDNAGLFEDVEPTGGLALLTRLLVDTAAMRPWEKVESLNGTRLIVLASPTRHEEIGDLLAVLRRLSDVDVVMNARLYEVKRDFFTRHVAPLFAEDKESKERLVVVRIKGPLFKRITQQKFLLESEDVKIRPNVKKTFLSHHTVFRFVARPHPEGENSMRRGSGLAGVSFEVRPVVSPDRRFLRLRITQQVAQLVRIDKSRTLDLATGKEVEVESPNVRKFSLTGTVQLPDVYPILMPVGYRLPGESGEDRVWLLVARPFIWIEAEERERQRRVGEASKEIWGSEIQKEEKPRQATPLPLNDDVKAILQAVLTDVLTNPELASTRKFYGTAADKTFTLEDGEKLGWPKEFKPKTHGYKLVRVRLDPFVDQRRVLGVRLDKFDQKEKKSNPFGGPIEVCLFNAGGSANGAVIGGCSVYYKPKRAGKRWTVEFLGLLDP